MIEKAAWSWWQGMGRHLKPSVTVYFSYIEKYTVTQ